MKYWAVRNLKDKYICITNKKPIYDPALNEWLFTYCVRKAFWRTCNIDLFKKLTGVNPPKEGKDGIKILSKKSMEWIKKL